MCTVFCPSSDLYLCTMAAEVKEHSVSVFRVAHQLCELCLPKTSKLTVIGSGGLQETSTPKLRERTLVGRTRQVSSGTRVFGNQAY